MRGVQLSVGTGTSPAAVSGLQVSPELFTTLGLIPVPGRGLVVLAQLAPGATLASASAEASLTFRVSLPMNGYARPEQRASFFETLLDRLRALPGVTHAGAVSTLPGMPERPPRRAWFAISTRCSRSST